MFSIELQEALRIFFTEHVQIAADEFTQSIIEPFLKGQQEIQPILDQWFKLVEVNKSSSSFSPIFFLSKKKECKTYTHHQDRPSDEHIFSNAFQTVLHTGTNYEILLQLEYTFQSEIEEMLKQRDKQIQELDTKFD